MSKPITLYDKNGNKFTAPSQEVADAALATGEYFEEAPAVAVAAELGLIPVDAVEVVSMPALQVDRKSGLATVYDTKGVPTRVWPVDAREMMRTGSYFANKPDPTAIAAAAKAKTAKKAEVPAAPAAPAGDDGDAGAGDGAGDEGAAGASGAAAGAPKGRARK